VLNTALTAASSVEGLLNQLLAVVNGAQGASSNTQVASTSQFKTISNQLAQLTKDATYQGLNILTSTNSVLSTTVSDRTAATFTVQGYNLLGTGRSAIFTQSTAVFNSSGVLNFSALVANSGQTVAATGFSQLNLSASQGSTIAGTAAAQVFTNTENAINNAITQLQGIISSLGTNVAILQARASFSTDYANTLTSGGDQLTLADLNTEAADSQALSLRQQLGIQSLTTSATNNSSILNLLRSS
jgi:flagellin-like hook-associated protein FlgL